MKHYPQLINKKVMLTMNNNSHTVKKETDLLKAYRFELMQPKKKKDRNSFWISKHQIDSALRKHSMQF